MKTKIVIRGNAESGYVPQIILERAGTWEPFIQSSPPVVFTFLRGRDPYQTESCAYSSVEYNAGDTMCGAELAGANGERVKVRDQYRWLTGNDLLLNREVTVLRAGESEGMRADLYFCTLYPEGARPHDLEYLAGSAFYRHLDPDHDGVPDTHATFNIAWCEDKLTFPAVAAYDPARGLSFALCRASLPRLDRDIMPEIREGRRFFVQDTEIGSLGFTPVRSVVDQVALRAHYPSYEGPQSFSIDRSGSPWGRFREAKEGASFRVAYLVRIAECASFVDAAWDLYTYLLDFYGATPPQLPYSLEEANSRRIELVNAFYKEWRRKSGAPGAAYILNFHPDEGRTLADVVEYGFTGRTITNAWASLRYGRESGDATAVERAQRVIDFYVRETVQRNGFVYGVYSLEADDFLCWWSGITLPCTFSKDQRELATHLSEEMAAELWPLAVELRGVRGNFTRSISESALGLLQCYDLENRSGVVHPDWLEAARRVGDLFLRIQNDDGSWFRAIDTEGRPVRVPEHWFGRTEEMRKAGTYPIPVFLIRLFEVLQDRVYLEAALRGADFLWDTYGRRSYYYGSLLDAPHGNMLRGMGPIFDNTTPLVAMELHLRLFQITSERRHLDAAIEAAKIACTWINLWDVPFPEGSTLNRYGLRTTGFSAVDIAVSSFQNDMMPLYWVRDLLKLAEITREEGFFRVARLIQFGENQMLSTEAERYGYARTGVQNEGRHLSWFLAKEWTKSFGFGGRGKGEENKTYYGWVAAVPLAGYYRILDEYGTVDFDEIHRRVFGG